MLKEGVFLGERYEILGRVGSGGMADVYKGKDHKLNRYVAIKVLKSDYRTDKVFIQKFLREAQAAAGLMHPNVVNVYDVGQDRSLYYMVMELVEGITLKEYIEKKGRLSAKETISISIQMITGIEAAHKQHIVHRDIKPQNIIISNDGKVKVTDFGIAKATTAANTVSTNVMGSVHYTSPEQARGQMVDGKGDIYSAGITMYEMITGHVPFDGDSTVSVAIKHLQEEIISPAEEVPDIPYSLECIILKCTQKNPEKRYHNAHGLIQDLKRSLVDPEGDFVKRSLYDSDATVLMSTDELDRIQKRAAYDDDEDDEEEFDGRYDEEEDEDGGQSEDVNPKMKKVMKLLMIVAAVIIVFTLVFIGGKAMGLFNFGNPFTAESGSDTKTVKVPELVGLTEKEAKAALNDKGLGFKVSAREASEQYDKGRVIKQGTETGKKVKKNTQIKVVVSTGKKADKVVVPDVVGQDEAAAQKTLEDKKFIVKTGEPVYSDSVGAGKVVSTDPVAGVNLSEGATVTMIVSLGAAKISVPNLEGLSPEDANAALSAAGLSVGNTSEDHSDTVDEGLVMSQSPGPGEKVDRGKSVDYVISKGKKTKMVKVPTLIGKAGDQASQLILDAGLMIGDVTEEYSNTVTRGFVISQTAASESQVPEGTVIGFVVSLGAEQATDPGVPPDGTTGE